MDDTRNIIDLYKYWTVDAIKADLDTKRHNFSVLITNQFNDFNIGTVIRNANAFLAKNVYIYGKKRYDRRGTVGTHLYENIKIVKNIEELEFDSNTWIVGIDNLPDALPMEHYPWPNNMHIILCFGQESIGLSQEVLDICDDIVYISQYGSVRSLNVGCASAIAMYDYCRKVIK